MESGIASEKAVINQLVEALQGLPDGAFQPPRLEEQAWPDASHRLDAKIEGVLAGRPLSLLIEVKKSVYPRDVRDILWQIRRFERSPRLADVPMLAAVSISPGAKELLLKEHVGYFDTGGSLYIPAEGAYVFIDKPPPQTLEKSIRTLFKGKRAQVLHALLISPNEWFGVKSLSALAQVSPATTSDTLSAIERFEWVEAKGSGPAKERRLVQPGLMLDEWAQQRPSASKERKYFVSAVGMDSFANRLAEACKVHNVQYALTREAAAQIYAPFLSSVSRFVCRMPPTDAAQAVLSSLEARIVSEGANLSVIETASQGEYLFREEINGVWLASPVQVYLDLLQGSGRSQEMAQHLRRERLGY